MKKELDMEEVMALVARVDAEHAKRTRIDNLPIKKPNEWDKVGEVDVDSGSIWLGDPCYVFNMPHSKGSQFESLNTPPGWPKEFGDCWLDYCHNLFDKEDKQREAMHKAGFKGQTPVQFNHDSGNPGLGICTSNGIGDGTYPVYVKRDKKGSIKEIKIVFYEGEIDDDE